MQHPKGSASAALYLVAWLPVIAVALTLKRTLLTSAGGGFDLVAHLGGIPVGESIPRAQQLALLREDVLLAAFVVPVALWLCLIILRPALRAVVAAFVSVLATLVLYVELKCYWEVATFLPARVLAAGAFGAGRQYVAEYMTSGSARKLLASVAFSLIAAAVAYWLEKQTRWPGLAPRLGKVSLGGLATSGAVAAVLWLPSLPPNPYDVSGFRAAIAAFSGTSGLEVENTEFDSASGKELLAAYRGMTRAPVPNTPTEYFGKAANYDVLIFMYESLPWACYATPAGAAALPTWMELKKRGFVATQHYTTYPYSRRAYYSIFSSWYPANGMRDFVEAMASENDVLLAPGMVRTAAHAGYQTAMFVPEVAQTWESDHLRFQALGFQRHIVPPNAEQWRAGPRDSTDTHREWRRQKDLETLALLKTAVDSLSGRNHRYLYAFNPQLTHGPWPALTDRMTEAQICDEGLKLYRQMDGWLGEIVEILRRNGTLDRTLIVTLGDHGLRTRSEFPAFRGGTLDDIVFHVPLMISAPGVLEKPVEIPWLTSHIDISPSVLDLLGMTEDREMELGSPMWNPRLQDRKTYFFARGYLGADGFRDGNEVVMIKYLFGGVSTAPWDGEIKFDATELLNSVPAQSHAVANDLYRFSAMQSALAGYMVVDRYRALFGPSGDAPIVAAPSAVPSPVSRSSH